MIQEILAALGKTVWGAPMLILLLGCGIYFSFRLGFPQITQVQKWLFGTLSELFGKQKKGGISPYRALTAALASSIGTGSIVGVATAISAGGAGAVFWMWVSAFFGMATKYAEIFLAVKYRKKQDESYVGGPMYYIEKGIGRGYKWMSIMFCICASFACLGMGAMNQANSVASVMRNDFGIAPIWSGIALAAFAAVAMSGGISRISRFAEVIVPVMALAYVAGGICIMIISPSSVLNAFSEIFRCALTPRAVFGAAAGEGFRRAVRFGVARGVFSNEAGLGSSPIMHATAETESPAAQARWGMLEVFVDTGLVCTVTAIAVISSGLHQSDFGGAVLVSRAFESFFGSFGGYFVGFATVMFSVTTVLGWSYYGERCVMYIAKEKKSAGYLYRVLFVCSVIPGAAMALDSVWELADIFNGLMAIPNMIALILLSREVSAD